MLTSFCGGRYFGVRHGDGPVVAVALPGWGRAHEDFESVVTALPFASVVLDLPGFGPTPPPGQPWSTEDYARSAAEVVEEVGGPVVIAGHSFGGRIAVRVAAARPDLVRSLVLTGAPLVRARGNARRRSSAAYRLARFLNRRKLVSDARMEALRHRYGSQDYRTATGVMRDVLVMAVNEDYADALGALDCPVELVWGDDDPDVPLAVAEDLERRLARATLTVVAGAGHFVPLTAPAALAAAIERGMR